MYNVFHRLQSDLSRTDLKYWVDTAEFLLIEGAETRIVENEDQTIKEQLVFVKQTCELRSSVQKHVQFKKSSTKGVIMYDLPE